MASSNNNIMISRELQVTLQLAMTEAVNRRHEFVCLEHLLFAMLHDVTTTTILKSCGADLDALRRKLAHYLDEQVERMPKGEEVSPRYAIGVQRALQRAALHVQSAGRQEITGGNVLVAMFHESRIAGDFLFAGAGRHALRRDQFYFAWRVESGRRRRRGRRRIRQQGFSRARRA